MFCQEARIYIQKLIRLQQIIEKKGYRRIDQLSVVQARKHLKKYLEYYRYDSDDQMLLFWERNRPFIRTLIPCEKHPAYQKLMTEYLNMNRLIILYQILPDKTIANPNISQSKIITENPDIRQIE